MPEELLATVVSQGPAVDGKLPATLVPAYPGIAGEPIVARRKVVFSGNTSVAPVQFFLDGKPFDASRDDAVVKGGTVEEWTLVNEDVFQHPFHIHVNPFQVIDINGTPVTDGVWWDTFPLPPKGSVKVRMKFRPDITGRTVYHCHILPHEDNGMMSAFTILPPQGGTK
jgi:FtsP/CotA-like multicopper oxidase with cupredoxin domain